MATIQQQVLAAVRAVLDKTPLRNLAGFRISPQPPEEAQVLAWDATRQEYTPQDQAGIGGGISAVSEATDVAGPLTYTAGNVLAADGTRYAERTPDAAGLVATTGTQTVAGVKTFSSSPVVPTPTTATQAANKGYVDAVATASPRASVVAATTEALPAVTYANGTAGVGATLTADANGAFPTIDGVTVNAGDRVLVKDQAATLQNGIYTLTVAGDGGTAFVLTRATDFDTADPLEIAAGAICAAVGGTVAGGHLFVCLASAVTIVVGTTGLTFSDQGAVSALYTAGDGLDLTGTVFSVGTGEVTAAMLAGSITDTKLATISTAGKVSGAALTSLASIPAGAGVIPLANLPSGTGEDYVAHEVLLLSYPSNLTWTNMPAAATDLLGNTYYRFARDTTADTQVRVRSVYTGSAAATAVLRAQYSTDSGSTWTDAEAAHAGDLALTSTGSIVGAWVDLDAGAKGAHLWRVAGVGGDGVADPKFRHVSVEFKSAVAGGGGDPPNLLVQFRAHTLGVPSSYAAPSGRLDGGEVELDVVWFEHSLGTFMSRTGSFVLPADLDADGTVTFGIDGYQEVASANEVQFGVGCVAVADDEDISALSYSDSYSGDITMPNSTTKLVKHTWAATVAALGWSAGDTVYFYVFRTPLDDGTEDTSDFGLNHVWFSLPLAAAE